MTQFNNFNKATLQALRAEMQAVLEKYCIDSSLEFEVGNMQFFSTEVEIKVKAKVLGAAKTRSDMTLESLAKYLGIKIRNKNGDRLIEYRSRNWKLPFIYEAADGTLYKCNEASAKIRFAA